ncbi:MAG: hypothetical protein KGL39_58320, partial [Patescibacteria group bacterium]|nr:hypothetical protein [Patescibacteria group bacterium]
QYGDSGVAQGGEALGEIATSLPAMVAGGEVVGPFAAGLSRAAPAVAPAVNFFSGAAKGNKLLRIASKGALGALQGGTATVLTSGGSDQPFGEQLEQGATLGGILSSAAPAAVGAGRTAYNKLTGGGINPATAALASKAVNEFGIPLRGSQITNSPFMRYLDSAVAKMPLSGLEAQNAAQKIAFSRAVASTFGESADNLTPQVMSSARTRIGKVFNDVASRTNLNASALIQDLGTVLHEASQTLPDSSLSPLLKQVQNIGETADQGVISGKSYQALTAKGAPLERAMNSADPNIRYYASQIRNALDDALQASASPEDLASLKNARLQWKNMRTVQDLAAKANIEGEISPALLLNAVKKSYKDMAYTGAGQIGDLADIGQHFLKEPPSSGTGERAALYSMLGLGAETAGEAMHNPEVLLHRGAMLGGLIGAGRMIGAGLKSTAYRNMLLRSVANGESGLTTAFGSPNALQTLGTNAARYALPAGVIVGNQLRLNAPPVAGAQ